MAENGFYAMHAALTEAPDPAFYREGELPAVYTQWFERNRRNALVMANTGINGAEPKADAAFNRAKLQAAYERLHWWEKAMYQLGWLPRLF